MCHIICCSNLHAIGKSHSLYSESYYDYTFLVVVVFALNSDSLQHLLFFFLCDAVVSCNWTLVFVLSFAMSSDMGKHSMRLYFPFHTFWNFLYFVYIQF
jgi:hypothetical protein